MTPLVRVPSGIAGLDLILNGGFLRGGIYIIQGPPGSGKTIFGNQVCYDHVGAGGRALYVTLLAENHDRMLMHMQNMHFFHPEEITRSLEYVSAFKVLEEEGLKGLLSLLRREIQTRKASVVVLDGLVAAEHSAPSELEFKKFIHGLQTQASVTECTMFLLTSTRDSVVAPEHTMVDGMIEMVEHQYGWRFVRELFVRKFRGSSYIRGRHALRITDNGLEVFPRTEGRLARPTVEDDGKRSRVQTGIDGLDDMLWGGLSSGSASLVFGPTGAGKTVMGLQFLALSSAAEPGLHFGFFEQPANILSKAERLGLSLPERVAAGDVELLWQAPTEDLVDALAEKLLEAVRRRGVRRLVIDGLAGLQRIEVRPERTATFFTALVNELRGLGATTLVTMEVPDLIGPIVRTPVTEISAFTDNLFLLRYVEVRSRLTRLISILKTRDSEFDPTLRELNIGVGGLRIGEGFQRAEAVLTGFPREPDQRIASTETAETAEGNPGR
jgi:circadian clock protein KaiC